MKKIEKVGKLYLRGVGGCATPISMPDQRAIDKAYVNFYIQEGVYQGIKKLAKKLGYENVTSFIVTILTKESGKVELDENDYSEMSERIKKRKQARELKKRKKNKPLDS